MSPESELCLSPESDICLLDNLLDNGMINVDFNFGSDPVSEHPLVDELECLKNSPSHESDSGMSIGSQSPVYSDCAESPAFEIFNDVELMEYLGSKAKSQENVEVESVIDRDINRNLVSRKAEFHKVLREKSRNARTISTEDKIVTVVKPKMQVKTVLPMPASNMKVIKVVSSNKVKEPFPVDLDSDDEIVEALTERNKRNAVQAKVNREKKKAYMKDLEDGVDELRSENNNLKLKQTQLEESQRVLEEEVEYLKSVIANQSALANLLQNIPNVTNVKLSTSFQRRKRDAEHDHDYRGQIPAKRTRPTTAGVCLHVDNGHASLEFCSRCSNAAKLSEIS